MVKYEAWVRTEDRLNSYDSHVSRATFDSEEEAKQWINLRREEMAGYDTEYGITDCGIKVINENSPKK